MCLFWLSWLWFLLEGILCFNLVHLIANDPSHCTSIPMLHVTKNIPPPEVKRKVTVHRELRKCVDDPRGYELPIKQELINHPHNWLSSRFPTENVLTMTDYNPEQIHRWNFLNSLTCDGGDNNVSQLLTHKLLPSASFKIQMKSEWYLRLKMDLQNWYVSQQYRVTY